MLERRWLLSALWASDLPAAGDWDAIRLDGGQALLDHVNVLYGAGPGSGAAQDAGVPRTQSRAVLVLRNSGVRDPFDGGVNAMYGGTVTIETSLIVGADRAVSGSAGADITIVNSTQDDNNVDLFGHGGETYHVNNTIISNSRDQGFNGFPGTIRYSNECSNHGRILLPTGLPPPGRYRVRPPPLRGGGESVRRVPSGASAVTLAVLRARAGPAGRSRSGRLAGPVQDRYLDSAPAAGRSRLGRPH